MGGWVNIPDCMWWGETLKEVPDGAYLDACKLPDLMGVKEAG